MAKKSRAHREQTQSSKGSSDMPKYGSVKRERKQAGKPSKGTKGQIMGGVMMGAKRPTKKPQKRGGY